MARILLSNATTFLHCLQSTSSASSSSSSTPLTPLHVRKHNVRTQPITCSSQLNQDCSFLTKRSVCVSLTAGFLFSLAGKGRFEANAAILEAEDDEELLEKVKKDRKKRLERQSALNSAVQETVSWKNFSGIYHFFSFRAAAYLQDLVYRLSRVGMAIEKKDLSIATSVLGQGRDADWIQKVKSAFNKLSSSPEENSEVETFSTSLDSLISSVTRNDIEASRTAFVASASALEKWTTLTGLNAKLKGL